MGEFTMGIDFEPHEPIPVIHDGLVIGHFTPNSHYFNNQLAERPEDGCVVMWPEVKDGKVFKLESGFGDSVHDW